MLLHRVPPTIEERRTGAPPDVEHLHELPELPEGVVAPDDLSGLEMPSAPSGVHWLRWVAVLAVLVIAAAVVLLVRGGSDQAEPTAVMSPAAEIVQSEIDAAIAEQEVAGQIRSHYVDLYAAYLAVQPPSAAEIVQSEIDAAIAEPAVVMSPAADIIQREIDHAINEQAVVNDILGYYEDLASRTG